MLQSFDHPDAFFYITIIYVLIYCHSYFIKENIISFYVIGKKKSTILRMMEKIIHIYI